MEALFWLSVGAIVYVYVGYPLVLACWARIVTRLHSIDRDAGDREAERRPAAAAPAVSVVIAARDEARRLPARIDNLLASDYPPDRLQIIVASDGSSDETCAALAPYGSRVELIVLPPGGKARALNAAVAHARHPILVFGDARQRFAPDAIRRLVHHFTVASVGAVSGELVLDCERAAASAVETPSTISAGMGAYWKYEKWLRRHEAIVGSTLGVTGAIYAMRRCLWEPLPPQTILDDVLGPMRIVLRGYRVIVDARALAFDETSRDVTAETQRKVRTLAGNFQLLALEPRLLIPIVNPVWLQFVSHKVGRLVVPYALVAVFVASGWLATESWLYSAALTAQLLLYGLAAYGAVLDHRRRLTTSLAEVVREAA